MTSIEITRTEQIVVARVLEDIDAANADEVRMQLAHAIDERCGALVLDLAGAAYLDSAGIDMLFRLGALLADRRIELRVVIPESSPLRRLAEIVSLPAAMPLDGTVEDAVAAAGRAHNEVASPETPQ